MTPKNELMEDISATRRPGQGPLMRVGMVGVGGFGQYRRDRMRDTGLFDIVACCDRDQNVLAQVCEQETAIGVDDYDRLLAVDGLEGIVISTGADTHAKFAIAAMDAGLHVFVEKPLCTSVNEVVMLREARKRNDRVVGVGHAHHSQDPSTLLLEDKSFAKRLGTLAAYEENSSHSGGLEIHPGDWRGVAERNPGGMLFQCGVHSLHRLVYLFGPIESVAAMMRNDVHDGTETADVASVLIHHRDGMVGTLNCYHITAYNHSFRVFGTEGNVYIDTGGNVHADTTEPTAIYQPRRRNKVEPLERMTMPQPSECAVRMNLITWYDAVRGRGRASPSLEDAIEAVLPVFAAERSASDGRQIELGAIQQEVCLD